MLPTTYIRIMKDSGPWPSANGPEIMVEILANRSVNLKAGIGYRLINRTIAAAIEANGTQQEGAA